MDQSKQSQTYVRFWAVDNRYIGILTVNRKLFLFFLEVAFNIRRGIQVQGNGLVFSYIHSLMQTIGIYSDKSIKISYKTQLLQRYRFKNK